MYAPKYQLRFNDLLGGDVQATLSFKNYVGVVTDLIGSGDKPVTIEFDGDENTIYTPIHQCFAKLNIYEPPQSLIDDIEDIEDTSVMLTIVTTNRRFDGFVVADNISRPLDLKASTLSLDGIDIFSIMKGKLLLDENDKVPYGKKTFRWFIQRCLALGTADGFGFGINFINDYHLDNAAGVQLLDEILFDISGFKDDDGRPLDCYSIMQRFAQSLFSTLHFAEGNLYFITPVSMPTDNYKNVAIKNRSMDSGFLIGNLENIGALRGNKEVSCRYDFGKNNGLLPNYNFADWIGNYPREWSYMAAAYMPTLLPEKVGTGRPESPFGVAITSGIIKGDHWVYSYSYLAGKAPVIKGSTYTVSIKCTYADFTQWYNKPTDRDPAIRVDIDLIGVSGMHHNFPIDVWYNLSATNGVQNISVDIPKMPENGILNVSISSVDLDGGAWSVDRYPERSKIIFHSVILSEQLDGQSGIKDYLTQKKSYTQLLSIDDATIGNAPSGGVSGAIYNARNIGATFAGSLYPFLYKAGEVIQRTALHQLVRAYMATSRKAAKKIEFTALSNNIRFADIIAINDTGRYIQVKNEYDLRNCTQKITAIELNKDFLPDNNTESTNTTDTYETYNTY